MSDYSIFGKNLKRILNEKHMTQKALALLCGINETNISYYVRSIHYPASNMIQDIAEALNVEVEEFFKSIN